MFILGMITFYAFVGLYGYSMGRYGSGRGWGFGTTLLVALAGYAAALCIAVGLYSLISNANADSSRADEILKQTAVRVDGLECGGSGSIITGKSGAQYVLTNAHVCNCARYKGIVFAILENGEVLRARIGKMAWESDLCAASVEGTHPALKMGPRLLPFTPVTTRGYPNGHLVESHGLAKGYVDWVADFSLDEIGSCPVGSEPLVNPMTGRLEYCRIKYHSMLSSLYARPGSSGSPVVDENGNLVGVISSFHPNKLLDAGQVTYEQTKSFVESL